MERLTIRNSEGIGVLKQPFQCERCGDLQWSPLDQGNGSPIDRLAEYEDFEEIFRFKMADSVCNFLKDKEEFAKWLDRNKWIAKKCDEYARAEEQWKLLVLFCAEAALKGIKDMENDERKYVIVCNKHSGNWPGVLLFWGHRTQDGEKRSFGGYTSDMNECELYSERDLQAKSFNFPQYHEGMTWEEFREYENIMIEPKYLEKLGYKQIKTWYMP